jgi:hypothetical protein
MDVKDFHEIFEHEIQVINKRREEFGHRLIVLEEVDRQRDAGAAPDNGFAPDRTRTVWRRHSLGSVRSRGHTGAAA